MCVCGYNSLQDCSSHAGIGVIYHCVAHFLGMLPRQKGGCIFGCFRKVLVLYLYSLRVGLYMWIHHRRKSSWVGGGLELFRVWTFRLKYLGSNANSFGLGIGLECAVNWPKDSSF